MKAEQSIFISISLYTEMNTPGVATNCALLDSCVFVEAIQMYSSDHFRQLICCTFKAAVMTVD